MTEIRVSITAARYREPVGASCCGDQSDEVSTRLTFPEYKNVSQSRKAARSKGCSCVFCKVASLLEADFKFCLYHHFLWNHTHYEVIFPSCLFESVHVETLSLWHPTLCNIYAPQILHYFTVDLFCFALLHSRFIARTKGLCTYIFERGIGLKSCTFQCNFCS